MQHFQAVCICCKQRTYAALKSFRCNIYKKEGGRILPNLELVRSSRTGSQDSILLQESDVNGGRDFDNLPGRRQAGRPGINLENDNVVRELVLRQQVFSARIDRKVPRLLAARGNPPGRRESSVSRIDGKNRNAVVSPV